MFFINRPYALLHHDKFDIRFHHLLDNMFAHAIWNAFYLSGIFLYYLLFALFQQDELHHFVFVPLNPRTSQIERIIGWVIYPSGAFPNSVQLRHAQAAGAYVTVLALCPWRVLPAVWTAGSALLCLRRRAVPRPAALAPAPPRGSCSRQRSQPILNRAVGCCLSGAAGSGGDTTPIAGAAFVAPIDALVRRAGWCAPWYGLRRWGGRDLWGDSQKHPARRCLWEGSRVCVGGSWGYVYGYFVLLGRDPIVEVVSGGICRAYVSCDLMKLACYLVTICM